MKKLIASVVFLSIGFIVGAIFMATPTKSRRYGVVTDVMPSDFATMPITIVRDQVKALGELHQLFSDYEAMDRVFNRVAGIRQELNANLLGSLMFHVNPFLEKVKDLDQDIKSLTTTDLKTIWLKVDEEQLDKRTLHPRAREARELLDKLSQKTKEEHATYRKLLETFKEIVKLMNQGASEEEILEKVQVKDNLVARIKEINNEASHLEEAYRDRAEDLLKYHGNLAVRLTKGIQTGS